MGQGFLSTGAALLARTTSSGLISRSGAGAPAEGGRRISIARRPTALEVLAHGGQRRDQVRRLGDVVEADDADVAADRHRGRPRESARAGRAPSGRWRRRPRSRRSRAAISRPALVAAARPTSRRSTCCEGRSPAAYIALLPAEQPGPCLGPVRRAGEVHDVGVPELDEVTGAELGAGDLVDADGPARLVRVALDDDDRDAQVAPAPGRPRAASSVAEISTIPSTLWSRRWSIASTSSSRVRLCRLTELTK